MSNVLLISHLIVTVFLILVVLFQRSEGGGLGMGSDNQGFGTGTKSANPLSKLTWILTALFFLNSGIIAKGLKLRCLLSFNLISWV